MPLDTQYSDAIKGFEGYTPQAQWDYKQNSNGYGTKAQYPGEVIDKDTAEQRFQSAINDAQAHVESVAPDAPLGIKAALTSLTYNAGPGWASSGLGDAVRSGDWTKAQDLFQQYNKAGGQVNPGLTARRAKEAAWFNAPPLGVAPAATSAAPTPPMAPPVTQGAPPVPVLSPGLPSYGFTPQNAPAPVSEAPQSPAPMAIPQAAIADLHQQMMGAPPRRPPDLAQLKALLSRSPGLPRAFSFSPRIS